MTALLVVYAVGAALALAILRRIDQHPCPCCGEPPLCAGWPTVVAASALWPGVAVSAALWVLGERR